MGWIKITLRSVGYQLTIIWREPIGLVINTIFAFGTIPLIGGLFGDFGTSVDGVLARNVIVWDAFGIFLAAAAFYTIPIGFSSQREYGLLKLFRASPITRSNVLVSFFMANFLYIMVFMVFILVFNHVLYGVYFPFTFDSIALLLLGIILGGVAMISLGLMLPAILKPTGAVAPLGTLLFVPSLFLSNLSIRIGDFPQAIKILAEFLPLTHTGRLLTASWDGSSITDVSYVSYLVLLAYCVVFAVLATRFLKWER